MWKKISSICICCILLVSCGGAPKTSAQDVVSDFLNFIKNGAFSEASALTNLQALNIDQKTRFDSELGSFLYEDLRKDLSYKITKVTTHSNVINGTHKADVQLQITTYDTKNIVQQLQNYQESLPNFNLQKQLKVLMEELPPHVIDCTFRLESRDDTYFIDMKNSESKKCLEEVFNE